MEKIIRNLKRMSLNGLGSLFDYLAEALYRHRLANKGYTPPELFEQCIGIGGISFCMEVIPILMSSGKPPKVALLKRETDVHGWHGQYHIAGTAARLLDGPTDMLARVSKELYGNPEVLSFVNENLHYVGTEVHNEPERRSTCWTSVWCLSVHASGIPLGWEFFEDSNDERIVEHHRHTLQWFFAGAPHLAFEDQRRLRPHA